MRKTWNCEACGATCLGTPEDGCTRCAMQADSDAARAKRRALLGLDEPREKQSIEELFATLGMQVPGTN